MKYREIKCDMAVSASTAAIFMKRKRMSFFQRYFQLVSAALHICSQANFSEFHFTGKDTKCLGGCCGLKITAFFQANFKLSWALWT